MPVLDRSLVIVTPKKPFLNWCRQTQPDRDITVEVVEDLPGAFLLPCCHFEEEIDAVLEGHYPAIFHIALSGWTTNQDAWPDIEDSAVFLGWFEVAFLPVVIDLGKGPLATDDDTVDA